MLEHRSFGENLATNTTPTETSISPVDFCSLWSGRVRPNVTQDSGSLHFHTPPRQTSTRRHTQQTLSTTNVHIHGRYMDNTEENCLCANH